MGYIRIPLETDPTTLAGDVFDYIIGRAPNWVPQDGNLDVWIIRAVTQLASSNRSIASDVQDDIFRYFGANLMGLQPIDAVSATGTTTWVLIDANGHTIPAGTIVGVPDLLGNVIAFQVVHDVTVTAGNTATASGAVEISAVQPGAAASGLGAVNSPVQLIDVIDWVQSITLTGPTAGGVDDETDNDYLNRLTRKLQGLSQRPILAEDYSSMAMDASTEVARAVTIDGYNPANQTYSNERMVAVAAVNASGLPVSPTAKAQIDAYLQSNREINFIVNVIDPKYTTINITTQVHNTPGYTDSAVDSAVAGAIHNYLDPANWGFEETINDRTWVESPTVYYNEVIAVISNVTGVDRVISLTLNGGTANIPLATPAALTQVGTIAITHA